MRLERGVGFRQLRTCRRTRPGQLVPLPIAPTGRGIALERGYLCRNASFHCRGGLRGVASVPAQAVAHRSRRRAPPELHHQIGGHHADDFSLAAASRRRCGAGRLVCTVRRWRRPDRQHRHRRRYRAAARRRCRRLSWVGVGRRNPRHAALGPDTHGGAASGNAGRLAGGRFRRHRSAAVGGARRR